ncbi:hypothetical protein [Streptoalloteichus hindustanus]|uniref:PE family protein n=1 Tax=Streptoalloteichus hindustanus TaxID=2017 RepID=A0A1M5L7S8_STRHI|nr:hypothetical protein [Streptoalloteichus hindustanus]SHG60985.1 hypothetical protein SAMN05444320_11114 [Streptoalloteichus hindustanus]
MTADSGVPKLVVAPENVEGMIRDLTEILARLMEVNLEAQRLTNVEAPGSGDPHTAFAIREISRLASDEDGCHGQANKAYRQAIQNVIDNLQASLDTYRQAEQANTMRA